MGLFYDIFLYFWNFRYLPLKYRWKLIKIRRVLLPTRSGLGLRDAFCHAKSLRHPPQNPYLFVFNLLWPFPTWHYPAKLPPPPRVIMANPKSISCQVRDLMYFRSMPLWNSRDTLERAFYRLYEAFCAADGHMIAYETEYIWGRSAPEWELVRIPDPQCEDTEQYAVMAGIAEMLVDSFMWRLQLGLRRTDRPVENFYVERPPLVPEHYPPWTAQVPAIQERLHIDPDEVEEFDSPLHRRNIFMATGHFFTI